jgi:GNAT superfamily N-acetyltransferase
VLFLGKGPDNRDVVAQVANVGLTSSCSQAGAAGDDGVVGNDMRIANKNDLNFLAECFIDISGHLKTGEADPYIQRLPSVVDESTRALAAHFIDNENAVTLIYEVDEQPVACVLGEITCSSFPPARIGKVGHIAVCWVAPEYRKTAVITKLVAYAENWFRERKVDLIELSYMAKNQMAARGWKKLGYEPFRVFSFKQL